MMRLQHSLAGKLFLAMGGLCFLVIALMVGFIAFNLRSGFANYLLDIELAEFEDLSAALARQYTRDDKSWQAVADHPKNWSDLIRANIVRPNALGKRPPLGERAQRRDFRPSAHHRPPPPPDPRRLRTRLALLDVNKNYLAGAQLGKRVFATKAIEDAAMPGQVIGYLALAQSQKVIDPDGRERAFVLDQLKALGLAALLALALAAFSAWIMARYFLHPIQALMQGSKRLAAGEQGVRFDMHRKDEIGALISHFNEMAQSLEAAKQAERQWVSDASHELKTPLAILRGKIEGLQDGIYQPDEAFLSEVHLSIMRLSALVNDLNILAQSSEAKLACIWREENLSEIIADCFERQADRLEKAGLAVDLHLMDEALIECDRNRIMQLLDNLIENCRRYTTAPGKLVVTLIPSEKGYVLMLDDTAPCPNSKQLPKLFDRFYRTEKSRNRQHGGSGLGLAICKAIVEAHGGEISASASKLGGLQIHIVLPCKQKAQS